MAAVGVMICPSIFSLVSAAAAAAAAAATGAGAGAGARVSVTEGGGVGSDGFVSADRGRASAAAAAAMSAVLEFSAARIASAISAAVVNGAGAATTTDRPCWIEENSMAE
jgi:hypothetical protein